MIRVVAAVIVRQLPGQRATVLACRRIGPPALAGRWEFPGGKVEVGESDETALHREIAEELRIRIDLHGPLGGELPMMGGPGNWQPYVATMAAEQTPELADHDEFRWLSVAELADVPWLASDVPVMADVAQLLLQIESGTGPTGSRW